MRNNKKNWEIFSKGGKENATIYDHFPTTPALITTTFNNGGIMNNVSENNNLVKTLRNDPNSFVITDNSIIKYCKDKKDEYLVYENVADNSISIEKIEVAQ